MQNSSAKIQKCPNCENTLQVNEVFITWCEKCCWNLVPAEEEKADNIFDSIYLTLSKKQSQTLYNSLINKTPKKLKPSFTFSKFIAFTISALVHLFTALFFILGMWLLIYSWENYLTIFAGIICLLIAWVLRPRIPTVPTNIVSRKDFSHLYGFVDLIAEKLEIESVDGIVINSDFNASFGQFGVKNKKILSIGLPYWSILSKEGKIAVISHELSHKKNGDPLRGYFIWTAIHSLVVWYELIYPQRLFEQENGLLGILIVPLNFILLTFSYFVWLLIYLLATLVFIDSQKAEYLADFMATKVCGTQVMINSFEREQLGIARYLAVLQRVSLQNKKIDFFEILNKDISSLPAIEKERIKRLGKLEESRLDSTHPPTSLRIEFLKNHPEEGIKLNIADENMKKIDEEVSKLKAQIQKEVLDIYKSSLYY